MAETIRWGILSTGRIAQRMVQTLADLPDAELVAVGSRSQQTADAFGEAFNVPKRYGNYEGVANDPDVDVIYVATPNSLHYENSLMCLEAGKHVLCEKGFTLNALEAERLIDKAREKKLFLMEGMWLRFFPGHIWLKQYIDQGGLGKLQHINVSFCWLPDPDPNNRYFDLALGGGALLDLGCYGVSFVWNLLGKPDQVKSTVVLNEYGSDVQESYILAYDHGTLATITVSLVAHDTRHATLTGTGGKVIIHPRWYKPDTMTLSKPGQPDELKEFPWSSTGQQFEVMHVNDAIRAGRTDSDIMPLEESLGIMHLLDGLRAEWGLEYPTELKA